MPPAIFETAIDLARRHAARIGARTLDTLHVASALELKAKHFWTFDERQAKLAKVAGLKVSSPINSDLSILITGRYPSVPIPSSWPRPHFRAL